ncbi:MAG: hypothetical protein R3280_11670 [Marinobacter sp.]|uniref:hypothetical protein n=1 Tax=Marinobacter sp. TaxID=50741 RepID=UPI00299E72A6|nr:hypothetical protein [Marinobacter sp.]MDX1635289.1 hypothetical protein [Marinobacter sp.]
MVYRIVTLVGAVLLVVLLFCLLWLMCRRFLAYQDASGDLSDRAMVLATWTFAGIAVGLVFAVIGAFVAGPWAFYRTLRSQGYVAVSDAGAIGWGLAIVTVALVLTTSAGLLLLYSVGAF